jgi:hypothetical protein
VLDQVGVIREPDLSIDDERVVVERHAVLSCPNAISIGFADGYAF